MKLFRPEPLLIERENGARYRIDPPTRRQVRDCLALDPADDSDETPDAIDRRVSAQLRILTGDHLRQCDADGASLGSADQLSIDELSGDEERELLTALISRHHGQNPVTAVAVARALKKNALELAAVLHASSNSTATA